jgi:secreted PhoX family phosphatase
MVRKSTNRSIVALAVSGMFPVASFAQFSSFTPLLTSVPAGSLPESAPFQLGNPAWTQVTISSRTAQLGLGEFNSGAQDMIAGNETGPDAGRYLFMPFESGGGLQRIDRTTNTTKTLVGGGALAQGMVSGDASRWTPWGGYLTAEESWGTGSDKGRLFEVTNPTTATGPVDTNFVHRSILPRVSHEGLAFDKNKSMYFIDELNGGSIYKYTPATPNAANGNSYFSAGTTSVMRVGTGFTFGETGSATWVPFTDGAGAPLAGVPTIVGGSIDGRAAADLTAYKGTEFNRPEDMEIQTLVDGSQRLYYPTTDTHQIYSVHLNNDGSTDVNVFVDRNTINAATGLPVGADLTNPDNVAIDSLGNMYIIEDQPGGVADIWFATDANRDGVAESIARWASMSTVGAEPTGLYFDPLNPNVAFVNVQHPSSGDDRTIMITAVPEPASLGLIGAGLAAAALRRRRR